MYTLKLGHSQNYIVVYLKLDSPSGIPEVAQSKKETPEEVLSPDALAFIDALNKNPESMNDFLSQFNPVVDAALSDPGTALAIEDRLFTDYQKRLEATPAAERLRVEETFTEFIGKFSERVARNLGDKNWGAELRTLGDAVHQQIALTQDRYSQLLHPTA